MRQVSVPPLDKDEKAKDASACFLMRNIRFDAPSLKMTPQVPAASLCCALCRELAYCTAFSWGPADGGTCYLKQWSGTATSRDGFLSGHFGRRDACACDTRAHTALRIPANDTKRFVKAPSHKECCLHCLSHEGCGGWTWAPAHGETGRQHPGCNLYGPLSAALARSPGLLIPAPQHHSALIALKRSVLFVHNHPPQQRLGSDRRLLAIVQQVLRLGWKVSYAGADNYDPGPLTGRALLKNLGAPLLSPVTSGDALVSFASKQEVSVVVLCLWFWGQQSVPQRYLRTLRSKLPHARLVVMSDDVHHRRLKLEAEDAGRLGGKEVAKLKDKELDSYFYADHVLTISDADKAAIYASLPPSRAMNEQRFSTLRHVYADGVSFPLERKRPFEQRSGLLFVGNLNNPTNLHGLMWFMREVWPLVRAAEPRMTLRVVGSLEGESAQSSGLVTLLQRSAGVTTSGYVSDDDMGKVLQTAKIFIAPIRWATGIVTKQTLAHVHGLPTVVTPSAAAHVAPAPLDGYGRGDVWSHYLGRYVLAKVASVAESAAEYAAQVLHVHANASAWEELSRHGAHFARSGGGGKGVCPSGLGDDWLAFWAKLQAGSCAGAF